MFNFTYNENSKLKLHPHTNSLLTTCKKSVSLTHILLARLQRNKYSHTLLEAVQKLHNPYEGNLAVSAIIPNAFSL